MDELTALAVSAQGGDRVALAAFVRGSQPAVWRLCAHLVGTASADDLTQDTYLRALRALDGFRGEASARTWLLAIARRACADHVRAAQRRRKLLLPFGEPRDAPDAAQAAGVDYLLSELEPERRAAFVLTQLLGLSYAETAAVCDAPVGTIRSRVARARDQLIGELRAAAAE